MADKSVAVEVEVKTGDLTTKISDLEDKFKDLSKQNAKMKTDMEKGFKAGKKGAKGLSTGFGGLLKSLGLIGIAMKIFQWLADQLMKNEKVMQVLNTAMLTMEIIFQKLMDKIEPLTEKLMWAFENPKQAVLDLWEAIKENIVNRLEGVVLAVQAAGKVIDAAFRFDWDEAKEGAEEFGRAMIQVSTGLDNEQQDAFVESIKETVVQIKEFVKEAVDMVATASQLAAAIIRAEQAYKALAIASQTLTNINTAQVASLQALLEIATAANVSNEERIRIMKVIAEAQNAEISNQENLLANEKAALQLKIDAGVQEEESLARKREIVAEELALGIQRASIERNVNLAIQEALVEREEFERVVLQSQLEKRDEEIYIVEEKYRKLEELAKKNGAKEKKFEKARLRELAKLKKKHAKEDFDLQVSTATSIANTMTSLSQMMTDEEGKATAASKAMAMAQILINTAVAIAGAVKTAATGTGNPWEMIAAIAAGIAAVVAGVAGAVSTLNQAKVPGGGGGGTASISAPAAPSIDPVTTSTTAVENAQEAQLAPIQAFVVETEMTGNQQNISQIENQVTFGIDG